MASATLPSSSPAPTLGVRPGLWLLGWAVGLGTHLLFFFTVPYLFLFLLDVSGQPAGRWGLAIDALLAMQFGVVHSFLLWPSVRRAIGRWMPDAWHGCLFCVATCLTVWLLMGFWQAHPVCLWNLEGTGYWLMRLGYFASWAGLLYSFSLTGFGYQTGFTPWWAWIRSQPVPRRAFAPRSLYAWIRHPSYLCFLGLIWFTPRMSLDHAVLTGVWTAYVLVGSCLKDLRMTHYLGDRYRDYARRVVGYPLMWFGPLARWK